MRFLIGLALIILASPVTLWMAETQSLVKDFENGTLLEGEVQLESSLTCPGSEEECLYVHTQTETLQNKEQVVCGTLPTDVTVIESTEDRCDANGTCEKCYRVESEEWVQTGDLKESVKLSIGGQAIEISEAKHLYGTKTRIEEADKTRQTITILPLTGELTVVTDSTGLQFSLSNMNYEQTLMRVTETQKSTMWAFRIFSLLLMVGGFFLLTSQFASPIIGVLRAIPFLGGVLNSGAQGLVYFVMALAGSLVWLILFLLVSVVSNPFLLIVVSLILMGILYLNKKRASKK